MTKTQQVEMQAEAQTAFKAYVGTRLKPALPEEYAIARKDYLRLSRNADRQTAPLRYLAQQNGFMLWHYEVIGQADKAEFCIFSDGKQTAHTYTIRRGNFLNDYVKGVSVMAKSGARIAEVKQTQAGNFVVRVCAGAIGVKA